MSDVMEVNPLQRSRELGPRIEALRAEATAVRDANWKVHLVKEQELTIERDQLARRRAGLERSAEEADRNARLLGEDAKKKTEEVRWAEAKLTELEREGKFDSADLLREALPAERAHRDANRARAEQAERDAVEHREQIASIDRRHGEIWRARGEVRAQIDLVELHTDRLEDQAELLQQVRSKWSQIALEPDNIPQRAQLELELEALTKQADAIEVDREVLRTVVPELPDTTPVAEQAALDDMVGTVAAPEVATTDTDVLGDDTFASSIEAPATSQTEPEMNDDAAPIEATASTSEPAAVAAEAPAVAALDDPAPVEDAATLDGPAMDQDVAFEEPSEPEVALDVA